MAEYPDLTEKVLGEFRVLRKLGAGGMAEVYLAEQISLQRHVAIKVMKPDMVKGSDEVVLARFKQEAMAAAGLNHPSIVQVYTVGETDGYHFIAQEYVQGKNLAEFLKAKGAPDIAACLHVMRHVAAALKAAGDAGIVHRDIKPENIMLSKKGDVKVADFGLAQLQQREEDVSLTQQGMTLGTPLYMSPEQVTGSDLDHRSDQYSFGVTCFHMLSGTPPFRGKTAMEIAIQHVRNEPPKLKEIKDTIPATVAAMVDKMMSKSPDDRYESAGDVLKDIRALARGYKEKKNLNTLSLPILGDVSLGLGSSPTLKPLDDSSEDFGLKSSPETPAANVPSSATPAAGTPTQKPAPKPALKPSVKPSTKKAKAAHTKTTAVASSKAKTKTIAKPSRRRQEDDEEEFEMRRSAVEVEEMDLTPMVDVTFLLLIFFMITASFSLQKAIETPAPDPDEQGAAAKPTMDELQRDSVIVEVDADNQVIVDDEPINGIEEIEMVLKDKIGTEQKTELVLEASPDATHEIVVKVIDAAKVVGMQRIRKIHRTE